jgi:hypothetical protein
MFINGYGNVYVNNQSTRHSSGFYEYKKYFEKEKHALGIIQLCQNTEETCQHLFLHCPFAKQCWRIIHIDIPMNEDFPEVTDYLKDRLQSQFFMAAVILVCWAIWTVRNDLIFRGS